MALQKNIEYKNTGVICNYTNVVKKSIRINHDDGSAQAMTRTFLSNAARLANKGEVMNKVYQIPAATFSTINLATTDPRDAVYVYLKTLAEFTGAIDV
jgi:hypothetical protein